MGYGHVKLNHKLQKIWGLEDSTGCSAKTKASSDYCLRNLRAGSQDSNRANYSKTGICLGLYTRNSRQKRACYLQPFLKEIRTMKIKLPRSCADRNDGYMPRWSPRLQSNEVVSRIRFLQAFKMTCDNRRAHEIGCSRLFLNFKQKSTAVTLPSCLSKKIENTWLPH